MPVIIRDEASSVALESLCAEKHDPVPQMFKSRVMALPAFHDAFTLASSLYSTTKDQQYVGVALKVAEVGVWAAANTALPLATPLVKLVGGWTTLEEWACKGLDRVEQAVPIITKPTVEIMSTTRDLVLTTLAGDKASAPPPTVVTALSTRANRTVACLAKSSGGRVAVVATDRFLDTAHGLLDTYLPPAKGDLHESDGRDGSLGVKAVALADKTRRRFKRTVYSRLNVNHNHILDDDDIIITVGHLVELGRRSLFSWYFYITHQPYVNGVMRGAGVAGTLVVDGAEKVHVAFMGGVKVVHTQVTSGVGRVKAIATKSLEGSVLKGGVDKASDIVMDGVGVVNKVTKTGMTLAHNVLTKGMGLVHVTVRGGLDVAHRVMASGVDVTYSLARKTVGTTHTVVTRGACVTRSMVTNAVDTAHGMVSGSINATKYMANIIPLTITSFIHAGYSLIHTTTSQKNTENASKITNDAPECTQDTSDALVAQITSSITSQNIHDSASNSPVCEELAFFNANGDVF